MFCEQCTPDQFPEFTWTYEEDSYMIHTNIFTANQLIEILAHAKLNNIEEIYVNTFQCETHGCETCFLLHIRSQQERDDILHQLNEDNITYNEVF